MKNVFLVIISLVILSSCRVIDKKDENNIKKQVDRFYAFPKLMENYYNTNDNLFKYRMNAEIDSIFTSPLNGKWKTWINEGSLGSCYYSNFTNENVNKKVFQDTIKNLNNKIQYIATLSNYFEYDSDIESIHIDNYKNSYITNATYSNIKMKIDYFVKHFIPFTIKINTIEKEKLTFLKINNCYLISSFNNECLEVKIEVIPRDEYYDKS